MPPSPVGMEFIDAQRRRNDWDSGQAATGQAATRQAATGRTATDYGLPAGNTQTSEYNVNRVYRKDDSVHTVPDDYKLDPKTDKDVRRHPGLDYSSRDTHGRVAKLEFSTPVGGKVEFVPGSDWNTINVVLCNGDVLQFLHASERYARNNGKTVPAGTVLGKTGNKGADAIHLHVQAKDKAGNFINPNSAGLPCGKTAAPPGGAPITCGDTNKRVAMVLKDGQVTFVLKDIVGLPGYDRCGSGTGDIHMATFDGLLYDLQAAGEFVVFKDTGGQMMLQIRLEQVSRSAQVTLGTAIAARVDGARVAIHSKPRTQVYVNGQPVDLERGQGMRLGEAGGITFTGTSWVIAWPDGTVGWFSSLAYLEPIVRPGSSAGKLVGLLGNADGKPEGDLVTRDGVVLPAKISFEELYGRFAESWRISQDESLFHYAAGESTATYTDRSVPSENVTVDSLDPAARAEAERLCRAAGIIAPGPLANCTLDLAVTGDRRFLLSAALAQDGTAPPSATTTAGAQAGSLLVSGAGREGYYVYDETGNNRLTGERPLNSVTELIPGAYVVKVGARSFTVTVEAGERATVSTS